jgi:hypothetical protein
MWGGDLPSQAPQSGQNFDEELEGRAVAARGGPVLTHAKDHGVEGIVFPDPLAVHLGTEIISDIKHHQRDGLWGLLSISIGDI